MLTGWPSTAPMTFSPRFPFMDFLTIQLGYGPVSQHPREPFIRSLYGKPRTVLISGLDYMVDWMQGLVIANPCGRVCGKKMKLHPKDVGDGIMVDCEPITEVLVSWETLPVTCGVCGEVMDAALILGHQLDRHR